LLSAILSLAGRSFTTTLFHTQDEAHGFAKSDNMDWWNFGSLWRVRLFGRQHALGLGCNVGKAVELLVSVVWLAITAWLILRAVKQRSLLPGLDRAASPSPDEAPPVTVIIPARDEEANIGQCLASVVAQDYPKSRLRVVVVDDHSADATGAIVGGFVARHPHIRLIQSTPLPPRWVGKSHACWIAARTVAPQTEWLCFIDADVTAAPAALSSAMHAALRKRLDLLSLAPHQELRSFAERLIMPCGLVLLAFLQDLRAAQAPSGRDVTATGQFMPRYAPRSARIWNSRGGLNNPGDPSC
jgi:chlorobactene glucosyltransferase